MLRTSHNALLSQVDELKTELKEKNKRVVSLESQLADMSVLRITVREFQDRVEDLKRERNLLKGNHDRLLKNMLNSSNQPHWSTDLMKERLQQKVSHLQEQLDSEVAEKRKILVQLAKEQAENADLKQEVTQMLMKHKKEVELLQQKTATTTTTSSQSDPDILQPSYQDYTKETQTQELNPPQEIKEEEKNLSWAYNQMKAAHAETALELEKTRDMLLLQHQINKHYQDELEIVKIKADNSEKEHKEEWEKLNQLLDLKNNRIQQLEGNFNLSDPMGKPNGSIEVKLEWESQYLSPESSLKPETQSVENDKKAPLSVENYNEAPLFVEKHEANLQVEDYNEALPSVENETDLHLEHENEAPLSVENYEAPLFKENCETPPRSTEKYEANLSVEDYNEADLSVENYEANLRIEDYEENLPIEKYQVNPSLEKKEVKISKENVVESKMSIEDYEEAKPPIENSDEAKPPIGNWDEAKSPIGNCDEAKSPNSDEAKSPIGICGEAKPPIGNCDEAKPPIGNCDEEKSPIGNCDEEKSPIGNCNKEKQSIEICDEFKPSIENCQEAKLSLEDYDEAKLAIENCNEEKECLENCKEAKLSLENCDEEEQSLENCDKEKQSLENCDKAKLSIENCKEAKLSLENCDEEEQSLENCEEAKLSLEDYDEAKLAIENCDEENKSLENCDKAKLSLENCDEDEQFIENCDEAKLSLENCDKVTENCDEAKLSLENCDEEEKPIENCDEEKQSLENGDKAKLSLENCDKEEQSIENCDEAKLRLENFEDDNLSIENCDEAKLPIENRDEEKESVENDKEMPLLIEDYNKAPEAIENYEKLIKIPTEEENILFHQQVNKDKLSGAIDEATKEPEECYPEVKQQVFSSPDTAANRLSEQADEVSETQTADSDDVIVTPLSQKGPKTNSDKICIEIVSLAFDPEAEVMSDESIQQVYVEYKFHDLPLSETETPVSLRKPRAGEDIHFHFNKVIDLNPVEHRDRRKFLFSMLQEKNPEQRQLKFIVVSDPEEQKNECQEVGYAYLELWQILDTGRDILEQEIDIINPQDKVSSIGKLKVSLQATDALQAIFKEMGEDMHL
ncbi:X-linked retinitis pigmentosa GTPase regulator-interacting protein 1 isoform X4 [Antechinus flavipes]|uniref:X-linked retinitis pigmentosa GTPase regulator-interacting protein 1 isoform X4 n=1 Tax=Antechinus flavipes TaxID=38775 RepID=UPI002235440C|nr:X-linked retinitis pigmentosa GTPase regulator-interacting protein 1 isoform X4 [Antechinus flavipes]